MGPVEISFVVTLITIAAILIPALLVIGLYLTLRRTQQAATIFSTQGLELLQEIKALLEENLEEQREIKKRLEE
jgi:hypothetical protein